MTLIQFLKNSKDFLTDDATLLVEDCPYAMILDADTMIDFNDRIVLGFDTKIDDYGNVVFDWIKVSAEVEEF